MEKYLLVYTKPTESSPGLHTPLSILTVGEYLRNQGNLVRYADLRTEHLTLTDVEWADTIGFSMMTGKQCGETAHYAKRIKQHHPDKKIIVGGFHPKSTEVNESFIDEVWTGDYDLGRSPFNEHTKKYFSQPYTLQHFSSIGCWGKCSFCCLKESWTPRNINEVVEDLDIMLTETGQKYVYFGDPNIGANTRRFEKIGTVMKKHGAKYHANIRPDSLSLKVIKALEDSGCNSLEIGCESGNDYSLTNILKKGTSKKTIIDVSVLLSESNISCMYSFMANYPKENKDMRNDTIDLIDMIHSIDSRARTSIYSYMPLPGTEMYDDAIALQGFVEPQILADWEKVTMGEDPIYWIAGLTFRKDNIEKNFPGKDRTIIKPYEELAEQLWNNRKFDKFPSEEVAKLIKKQIEKHK